MICLRDIGICCFLIYTPLAVSTNTDKETYRYIPDEFLSFCTRHLNTTGQVGCSSGTDSTSGPILLFASGQNLSTFLHASLQNNRPAVVIGIDYTIFINVTLMQLVRRSSPNLVAGVLVFAPPKSEGTVLPAFSESQQCPNGLYSYYNYSTQCSDDKSSAWNVYGSAYSSLDWPIPVVLINDWSDEFKSHPVYCDQLTGSNIVFNAVNNTWLADSSMEMTDKDSPRASNQRRRLREGQPTVLVLSRTDSRSLFERATSTGLLASVSVLLSTAVGLARQPDLALGLHCPLNLVFAFIDNEAYDLTGSTLLSYYLTRQGGGLTFAPADPYPVTWDNVSVVIEVGELAFPTTVSSSYQYYLRSDAAVLAKDDRILPPGWVRSRSINSERFVRYYRTASALYETLTVGWGIFLVLMTSMLGYYIRPKLIESTINIQTSNTSVPHRSTTITANQNDQNAVQC